MISDKAIIDPTAKIAPGVSIGAGTVIGADVVIGAGTWIGPHAVIQGPTIIGENNKIFQFASIGDEPQDITYAGEPTELHIGNNNVIREFCTISRGTQKGGGKTSIGDHNFLMAYTHVGHDCLLGNHIIMVNYSALSGHSCVEDHVNIGAYAGVHQFCHIGQHSFIARATYLSKDVLPYVMVAGYSPSTCGINTVGLRRHGFSANAIDGLRRAYKIIFRKGNTVQQAIEELLGLEPSLPEVSPLIKALNHSTRGIVR